MRTVSGSRRSVYLSRASHSLQLSRLKFERYDETYSVKLDLKFSNSGLRNVLKQSTVIPLIKKFSTFYESRTLTIARPLDPIRSQFNLIYSQGLGDRNSIPGRGRTVFRHHGQCGCRTHQTSQPMGNRLWALSG